VSHKKKYGLGITTQAIDMKIERQYEHTFGRYWHDATNHHRNRLWLGHCT
jgi:hypothetical protein